VRPGLVTSGRLLAVAEADRVRWALQHLPDPAAKFVRAVMDTDPGRAGLLAVWETGSPRAAWNRLRAEGRLSRDWGISPEKAVDRGRRRREDLQADLDADQIITRPRIPSSKSACFLTTAFACAS